MFRFSLVVMTATLTMFATVASAQHSGMPGMPGMSGHNAAPSLTPADTRELVQFPPEMQVNFLHNMRDHVETLNVLLQAVSAGDYAAASKIAAENLGLDSPSAAGCKPDDPSATGAAAMSKAPVPGSMDAMMKLYMPEAMRNIGLSMHTSASAFAVVAAKAVATHDTASVIGALSQITPNCVACHSAYRLR
jgi:hypothetical protein